MERENGDGGDASRSDGSQAPPKPGQTNPRASIVAGLPYGQPIDDGNALGARAGSNSSGSATLHPPAGPSPNQFVSDPARTHRTWAPKYGRVQKCDFCNGRSPGTLQGCTTCQMIRICEDCARGGRWHTNRSHFIDADACDWAYKPQPRKRGVKRGHDTSSSTPKSTPGPSEDRSPPARRRKLRSAAHTNDNSDDDNDGDWAGTGMDRAGPGTRRSRQSSTARRDSLQTPLHHSETQTRNTPSSHFGDIARPSSVGNSSDSFGGMGRTLRGPRGSPALITAAATRPNVRQAAARALEEMSHQSRQTRSAQRNDTNLDDFASVSDDDVTNEERGVDNNVNNRGSRRGNQAPRTRGTNSITGARIDARGNSQNPGSRWDDTSDPLVAAGLRRDTPGGRDILVGDVHEFIYRSRPDLGPYRSRTQIPNHWGGQWPALTTHARQEPTSYDQHGNPNRAHVHEQYHREHSTATARHDPNPPPAPWGYEQHPFTNYPNVSLSSPHPPPTRFQPMHSKQNNHVSNPLTNPFQQQHHPAAQNSYHPTSRTTPSYHPYNELTPDQLQLMHNDRMVLNEMQFAWEHAPTLLRLRHAGFRIYALGLLWDVFEERRRRSVLVLDNSQVVRWFVDVRDGLARELQMQQQQYGGAREASFGPGPGQGQGQGPVGESGGDDGRGALPRDFPMN